MKRGGKAFGVVVVPEFVVISCSVADGNLDLVVPRVDESIVARVFRHGAA